MDFLQFCITVLLAISQVSSYCRTTPDPCLETTYTKLNSVNDSTRSSSYFDINAPYFGDYALLEGWYRATTGALSGDMPTEAPNYGYCQALYPVWFNETFPTLAEGSVQRKACMKTVRGNCTGQLDICIKKCNLYNQIYNVYWLSRPSNTNARYCFDYIPTTTVVPQQARTTSKTYSRCTSTTDPCTTHDTINTEDRNVEFSNSKSQNLQDASIIEQWYRAVEPAGVDMPTSAPGTLACQALSPVWLNETMPSVSDGIVDRKACVVDSQKSNCSYTLDICIKNCGNYNVYFLSRPSNTYARYCFASSMGVETSTMTSERTTAASKTTTAVKMSTDPEASDSSTKTVPRESASSLGGETSTMTSEGTTASETTITTNLKMSTDPEVSDSSTGTVPRESDDLTLTIVLAVVVGVIFLIIVLVMTVIFVKWKSRKQNQNKGEEYAIKRDTGHENPIENDLTLENDKMSHVGNAYSNVHRDNNGAPAAYSQYQSLRQSLHGGDTSTYQPLEARSEGTKYEEIPADYHGHLGNAYANM